MVTARAYLVKIEPEGFEGDRWEIADKPLMIGRSKEAGVMILSRKVSRVHCVISLQGPGGYTLADLHSTNGTRVNDCPIDGKVVALRPYDRIAIGEANFVFKLL